MRKATEPFTPAVIAAIALLYAVGFALALVAVGVWEATRHFAVEGAIVALWQVVLVVILPYAIPAILALSLSLYYATLAQRERNAARLRQAGILAILGGVQHPILVGIPAIVAGMKANRTADRLSPAPFPSVFQEVRAGWSRGQRSRPSS